MKYWRSALIAVGLSALLLAGCEDPTPTTVPTAPTTIPTTAPTTAPTTQPTEPPTTLPLITGWQDAEDGRSYYDESGVQVFGWLSLDCDTYYFDSDGYAVIGWLELDAHTYYFNEDGRLQTGWLYRDGKTYYFGDDGVMTQGWLTLEDKRYYFSEDGAMQVGWLELGEYTYYLQPDGTPVSGPTEIDGVTCYFTPDSISILLVNPWHMLPEDYSTELTTVEEVEISVKCAAALEQMLAACRADGGEPIFASGNRTMEHQTRLYTQNVQKYLNWGYSYQTALELAGREVTVPGTSEHQLGLAVDIVDAVYWNMDEEQENTYTQQWLMAHCWEYGFILRYPNGTTDITGIIYEPWHYRYVGVEVAMQLRDLGITLEEYLGVV